jgi:hypothetical protein
VQRFLGIWLLALFGFAVLVLALTVGADPYGLLGTPRLAGLNADKPAAADRPRLTKPYLVERQDWSTLVIGASNADVGFDPQSAAWPEAARPVFNLAIDGSGPAVQARFLQHALETRQPRFVLIGVALEDAMVFPARRVSAATSAQAAFEPRLRTAPGGGANPEYGPARLKDLVFATFSIQALSDSVATLLHQGNPERTQQTAEGRNSAGNFARWLRTEGSYSLVMTKDREKTPQLLSWAFEPRTSVSGLAEMIRTSRAHGAKPVVFIMPSYVDQLEILRQTSLTPLFEQWKQDVARTVEAAAGAEEVPLWDFSGYSPYTTETLPGPRDTGRPLQWFWEFVHFRSALGDLMVQRMLGAGGPADFGARVTSAALPGRFAAFANAQRAWVATHPDDVSRLAAVIDAAAQAVCGGPVQVCPRPGMQATASR